MGWRERRGDVEAAGGQDRELAGPLEPEREEVRIRGTRLVGRDHGTKKVAGRKGGTASARKGGS
jgi:hypothetical protein